MQPMRHRCPVCGYDRLSEPPANFMICPSCGTEFEYHDATRSHAELRRRWIAGGAKWWSREPPPPGWSAEEQLRRAGFLDADAPALARAGRPRSSPE